MEEDVKIVDRGIYVLMGQEPMEIWDRKPMKTWRKLHRNQDGHRSQYLWADYEEIMQGSSLPPNEQQIVEQANTGEVY